MKPIFKALPTEKVRALQAGGPDAYGLTPERKLSAATACLAAIACGTLRPESLLVLAYRPFPGLQPYAETGPIFLHAEACERAEDAEALPELFGKPPDYIVRGYGADDRIVYGTGAVVPTAEIPDRAAELLARPDIAYLHMRSAKNNCYQCRIERD